MPFELTLERKTGTGDTELHEFHDVVDVMNVPMAGKTKVTLDDGTSEMVPAASVVTITDPDQ